MPITLYGCVNWTDYTNEQVHYAAYGECDFRAEGPGRIIFGGDHCEYYRIGCVVWSGEHAGQVKIPATTPRLKVVVTKEHKYGLRQPHFPDNLPTTFLKNTYYYLHFDVVYSCWGEGHYQSLTNPCTIGSSEPSDGRAGICASFGGASRLASGYKPYQNIVQKPTPGHYVITLLTYADQDFDEHVALMFGNSHEDSDTDTIIIDNVKLYKEGDLSTNLLLDSGFNNGLPQNDWQDLYHVAGSHGWTEYGPDDEQYGCINWTTGQFEVIVPDDYKL